MAEETAGQNKLQVGDAFRIMTVEVTLLTGETFVTSDPAQLATRLATAYKCVAEDEIPAPEHMMRIGYQSFKLSFECGQERNFEISYKQFDYNDNWPQVGGPEVEGEAIWNFLWSRPEIPIVRIRAIEGRELAKFFSGLAHSPAIGLLKHHSKWSGSPMAHTDFVMLNLEPSPGIIAQGTFGILHSTNEGDMIRDLYDLELADPDNPDYGRGDHVGNYTGLSRSYGL